MPVMDLGKGYKKKANHPNFGDKGRGSLNVDKQWKRVALWAI